MKHFLVLHLLDNLPGTACGGRSLRNFIFSLTLLQRSLPQSLRAISLPEGAFQYNLYFNLKLSAIIAINSLFVGLPLLF